MKTKGLSLASTLVIAALGLYGCTEGDESVINITSTSTGGGGGGGTTSTCPSWASARPIDGDGNDVCQLPSSIMQSRSLTADTVWYMDGTVTVGNGNEAMSVVEGTLANTDPVADVTLSIEAGTEIKGQSGSFANLIITRGSQIQAIGTATDPIIFSSDDDGYDGTGEWGGLILHGYAPHNECLTADMGAVACNVDSEGESGFAGGYTADDDSGTMRYVIVTEGGFEFAIGNEINGISMVGVGSGTEMEFIQVNSNADDGVEYYGGNVSGKYIVLTGNLDDSVDWDEGWQGNLQHVLVIQSVDTGGNVIEADTEGTLDFLSKPTIANATFIGNGSQTTGAVFKATSGGFVHHSVFAFDAGLAGPTTCVDSADAAVSGTELVFTNVVGACDTSGDVVLVPAPIADAAIDGNWASQAAEAQAATVGTLDIATINTTYAESVADETFFDQTDYAGAVNPDGSDLWFEGWTLPGTL
jgi:hypothetical protein